MSIISRGPFYDRDDIFGHYRNYLSGLNDTNTVSIAKDWRPIADISETKKEYVIKAELPEVEREDVHVSVDNGYITISGERSMDKDESDAKQHRIERFYGTFSRSFSLPADADAEHITAKSKNGVLKVRVPKTKANEPSPVKIPVR